jgi:1,2-diacylglycerol 3-beta-glucosyltransferase
MMPVLEVLTFALLIGWPTYNLCIAALALRLAAGAPRHVQPGSLRFWVMIPALNEAKVIANTVRAALALDSPLSPVRVLVVDDGSDDETPDILAGIRDRRLHVLRRDAPDARQGKGEALNAGYRKIRRIAEVEGTTQSTVVGVIDGDGRADSMLLHTVADLFADRWVGAVQTRVRIQNRRPILGLLQDLEFACVANASQTLRDRLGSVGMGGNGQFVRLSALAKLGESPWSSCLVEDLELGLRLHLAGVTIRYSSIGSMSQQAVVDVRRLVRQRTRWAQGNLQCARYVRPLFGSRRIGSLGLIDFLFYLVSPWLTIPLTLFVLAAVALVVTGLATGQTFGGLVAARAEAEWAIGLWVGAMFVPGLLWGAFHWWRIGDEPLRRCLFAGLCYPGFLVLGVIATWRAVLRHAAGRNSWAKTERTADTIAAPAPPEPSGGARRAS